MLAPLAQSLSERGPDDLRALLAIVFAFTGLGFVVGLLGHLLQSRTVVGMGIAMTMIGAAAFVVATLRFG